MRSNLPPHAAQSHRQRCLEWTFVRRRSSDDDDDVENSPEYGEGDEDVSDGRVEGPHVFAESKREKKESDLEHDRETLNEEMETPLLESITFALTISATFNHRPARIAQVAIQPLLSQHREERSE